MNGKQKKAYKGIVADLMGTIHSKDRPKLRQLERLFGELRRERGSLSAKAAEIESKCAATKSELTNARTAMAKRVAAMKKGFAKAESALRAQIRERDELIASLSQRFGTLQPGLFRIEISDWLYITKDQLIRANQASIRLGYNRNLSEDYLMSLPDQYYFVGEAFYHVGLSGREFQQLNYRLMLILCRKIASPHLTEEDMEHVLLDVSAEVWEDILRQECVKPVPNVA